jgi:MFS family permease
VPIECSGLAIGLISTLGYLPEVLCPITAGKLLDKFPGATGYQIYFSIMIGMAVLGVVLAFVWSRTYGAKRVVEIPAAALHPAKS